MISLMTMVAKVVIGATVIRVVWIVVVVVVAAAEVLTQQVDLVNSILVDDVILKG